MYQYETMYILKPTLEDAERAALIEEFHAIIPAHGGTIDNVDDLCLRESAYEIDGMTKGYYVVVTFTADNDGLNEMNRRMGISSDVVRSMTINLAEKKGK